MARAHRQHAPRPRHQWGTMTRATRDRVAREAADVFGLSRRSVREMYNRGTFRPMARDPQDRVPQKFKRETLRSLRNAAAANVDATFRDELSWETGGRQRFETKLEQITDRVLLNRMAVADGDDIRDWAHWQQDLEDPTRPQRGTPQWLVKAGWVDQYGYWNNPFWYH